VIERTEIPEDLREHEVMVVIQRYFPRTRSLSPKQEIIVNKRRPALALRDTVAALSGIDASSILLSTPYWAEPPTPEAAQWERIKDDDERPLSQVMWHMKDGELVLYKDETEEIIDPNKDENIGWTNSRLHYQSGSGNNTSTGAGDNNKEKNISPAARPRPKEVGIKIRTHQQNSSPSTPSNADGAAAVGSSQPEPVKENVVAEKHELSVLHTALNSVD